MSKIIKLADGREYTATISSTIEAVQIPVESFSAVDSLSRIFVAENLTTVVFDGRTYHDATVAGISAETVSGRIFATVHLDLSIADQLEEARREAVDAYTMQLIEEGLL